MRIIRHLQDIPTSLQRAVVTIGNFDGVHLGHKSLLKQLIVTKRKLQAPLLVVTFEPQPEEYFAKSNSVTRILKFCDKVRYLKQNSVDAILVLRFQQSIANMQATEFIEQVILDGLKLQALWVGDDFRFGYKRSGDFSLLNDYAKKYNFILNAIPTYELESQRVSSTQIRKCLSAGNLRQVEKLLGRSYQISGKVCHGNQFGRKIGFPTANLPFRKIVPALSGIFVVSVDGLDELKQGVASLGTRPTVDGTQIILEVHIFDFDQVIYGKLINVHFHKKLRNEIKYNTIPEMVEQIKLDAKHAKEYFRSKA